MAWASVKLAAWFNGISNPTARKYTGSLGRTVKVTTIFFTTFPILNVNGKDPMLVAVLIAFNWVASTVTSFVTSLPVCASHAITLANSLILWSVKPLASAKGIETFSAFKKWLSSKLVFASYKLTINCLLAVLAIAVTVYGPTFCALRTR